MTIQRPRPLVLIILDGWGYRKEEKANAIAAARKPCWDEMCKNYPHALITGSGHSVGLPVGQMGNSEVGHLNMGAGRIVNQDLTRIDLAIDNGDFFQNEVLVNAFLAAKHANKAVHVMGLLSPGGVHSHEKHIQAVVELAANLNVPALYLHALLDGRDTPPKSAAASIKALESLCQHLGCGKIVSLVGRYYAMDRDKRWERVAQAYDLIALGKAPYQAATAEEGLQQAYLRNETDEFVSPTCIHDPKDPPIQVEDGDTIVFMNFRADRARELTRAFIEPDFKEFPRTKWPKLANFVCLAVYDKRFNLPIAYPPQELTNILAECLSNLGLKQLRIAETEKYAHVTFFFNGGIEKPFPGEDRLLIPSPKVATYDLHPQMSAPELTDRLIEAIESDQYDVIISNFANPDMVGHTGNFDATVTAIETVDTCLGRIITALKAVGGEAIITADHGNAEQMFDYATNQPHTAHTSDPIPFIYVGRSAKIVKEDGKLSDISPTMLYLLSISQPPEMTGKTLLELV